MKFAIIVNEDKKTVSEHFGGADGFLVINGAEQEYVKNPGAEAEVRKGKLAVEAIIETGVEALILGDCSISAGEQLKAAGVELYKIDADTVEENISLFNEKKLEEFTEMHENRHLNADGRCEGQGKGLRNGDGIGAGRGAGEGLGKGIGNNGEPQRRNLKTPQGQGLGRANGQGLGRADGQGRRAGRRPAGAGRCDGTGKGFGAGMGAGRGLGRRDK